MLIKKLNRKKNFLKYIKFFQYYKLIEEALKMFIKLFFLFLLLSLFFFFIIFFKNNCVLHLIIFSFCFYSNNTKTKRKLEEKFPDYLIALIVILFIILIVVIIVVWWCKNFKKHKEITDSQCYSKDNKKVRIHLNQGNCSETEPYSIGSLKKNIILVNYPSNEEYFKNERILFEVICSSSRKNIRIKSSDSVNDYINKINTDNINENEITNPKENKSENILNIIDKRILSNFSIGNKGLKRVKTQENIKEKSDIIILKIISKIENSDKNNDKHKSNKETLNKGNL